MDNNLYFENLKLKRYIDSTLEFPNLTNIQIKNNILYYNEMQLELKNIELYLLDTHLFSLDINEIFYIIRNIISSVNNPEVLKEQVNYMYFLLKEKNITEEQKQYLYNYINDYHKRKNIMSKYIYEEAKNELALMIMPINEAYNEYSEYYENEASVLIRYIELEFSNKELEGGNGKQGPIRIRTSSNIKLYNDELESIAGFASGAFIISITTGIGILVALAIVIFVK